VEFAPVTMASAPALPRALQEQLDFALSAALRITGDIGNVQLFDPLRCSLRIASQCGFGDDFLSFFGETHEAEAACGTALLRGARVIVEDVAADPIFIGTEACQVMLAAGARAVQSTPLRSSSGAPLGIISTHYHQPTRPSDADLRIIDRLARQTASLIENGFVLVPPPPADSLQPAGGGQRLGYELFNRISGLVTFVERVASRKEALAKLETWSLREPGEFVLFHNMNVIAVARCGIVKRRVSLWHPSGIAPGSTRQERGAS
jgi:hypothetical protein